MNSRAWNEIHVWEMRVLFSIKKKKFSSRDIRTLLFPEKAPPNGASFLSSRDSFRTVYINIQC